MDRLARVALIALVAVVGCSETPVATDDGGADASSGACTRAADCDDALFCNGAEACDPDDPAADADGCVAGDDPCADGIACDEASDACGEDCDADDDGEDAVSCGGMDCDDDDPAIHPGAVETCDAADVDEDCDPTTYGDLDADVDGADDAACCNVEAGGEAHCGTDCDDTSPGVGPTATESCNMVDDDCDDAVDETTLTTFTIDADGDGFGAVGGATTMACSAPPMHAITATDCDDGDAMINPAADEECDTVDNDCSGTPDEGCDCADGTVVPCGESDGMGGYLTRGDCVPGTRTCVAGTYGVCTGAVMRMPENCSAGDEDCDGMENEADAIDASTWYRDADGDLYGAGTPVVACVAPPMHVAVSTDCNDGNAMINPAATETCDGLDNDCSGTADPGCLCVNGTTIPCGEPDGSGGFVTTGNCETGLRTCVAGMYAGCVGAVMRMPETCTAGDEDCDGMSNEADAIDAPSWYRDGDGDGYGAGTATRACTAPAMHVSSSTDCNDTLSGVNPAAMELCNAINDDCDGTTDEPPAVTNSCTATMAGHTYACLSGTCRVASCPSSSFADCDLGYANGCEVDLRTTRVHCGACGTTCRFSCSASTCDEPTRITAGDRHTCVRQSSGALACWGQNGSFQLGDSTVMERTTPVSVLGLTMASSMVVAGTGHTCALRADGAPYCWGDGTRGQVGSAPAGLVSSPRAVTVSSLMTATTLSARAANTCAIRMDRQAFCWGANNGGQTGDGYTDPATRTLQYNAPRTVVGLTDATAIATGNEFSCAIRASGQAVCWGHNFFGQLGDGVATHLSGGMPILCDVGGGPQDCSPSFVSVSGVPSAIAIAAGSAHACAIRTGGQVVCWGNNDAGQLGAATGPPLSNVPVTVAGVTNATALALGNAFTCAIRAGGTVSCWGYNMQGQLGQGTTSAGGITVVDVPGLSGVVSLAAGANHACAAESDGDTWCWGQGSNGQLGDGGSTMRTSPVRVSPLR